MGADVSNAEEVDAAIATISSSLGPVDVLVCSAGIGGDSLHTVEVTDEEWRRVFAVNCDGVFYANRGVLAGMVERGYGRIVNVASIAGKEGNPMAAAYSASKAAVIGMTKSIGKDVAGSGVLVNCIAPAVIRTPLLDQLSQDTSTTCSSGFRWDGSARSRRWPSWSHSWPVSGCHSRPARPTTSPAAGRRSSASLAYITM